MDRSYESLVTEIDRIVTSPYPTQLKTLRDLACSSCTLAEITRWARSRPCQIAPLVECLLDGLRQWPYVLELFTRLASDSSVRDALLAQSPALLHDIVCAAASTSSLDSRYVVPAVVLLSKPLPEDVAMPAKVQTLFIRLFDQAAEHPSLDSIRSVYRVLSGTSTSLLGLLSSSSLLRLEQHLFDIIRNIRGENQSLSLYCLAIMRLMCSAFDANVQLSNSQYDTQELLASTGLTSTSKWNSDSIQQFFTDDKAQRTMQLVVLRAVWACTVSTGEPFDERMESLVLANEVISAILPHLREAWRKSNSLIVGKLQDKIMSANLEPELKFHGHCFLAQVTEGSRVPATVMDGLRTSVTDPSGLRLALRAATPAQLTCLLEAGVFNEDTLATFLQSAVDYATASGHDNQLETTVYLRTVLHQIYAAMANDPKLSEGTMLALDVITCGQKLRKLLCLVKSSAEIAGSNGTGSCDIAMQIAHRHLAKTLCEVFLRAALSASHQSYSASQDTITLLLELHASSASSGRRCHHAERASDHHPLRITSLEGCKKSEDATQSWRDTLRKHVYGQANIDADRLTSLFAEACSQLEARCETVEAPLKEEKERYADLQRMYHELEQGYSVIVAERTDRQERFEALEAERDQYVCDLERQHERTEGHERRIEELLLDLQKAREEAEQSRRKAQTDIDAGQMQHAASAARYIEELEELQTELRKRESEASERIVDAATLREERDGLQQALEQSRVGLGHAQQREGEQHDEIARLRDAIQASRAKAEKLTADLNAAQDDAISQGEAFERDLNDLRAQASRDLASVDDQHEQQVTELTRSYEETAKSLRKQLADVQEEVSQAREQHRTDIEQWEAEIGARQKKVDRLVRKCTEKDKQIAVADSMRSNLMAAMGINAAQMQAQINAPRTAGSSATQRQSHAQADTQDDQSPPTPFSGDDSQQINVADASFNSNATSSGESRNGPTPKRPRPRRSLAAQSTAKPTSRFGASTRLGGRASVPPQTSKSTVKVRQPLLGVSGNEHRLPVRSSLKTPTKRVQEEEEFFSEGEVFSGTQSFAAGGAGAAFDEETETGL